LPTSITELSVGCYFNQPILVGVLPINLRILNFGVCFNQPLPILPSTLTTLHLGMLA
jgi:hypothetical protein